MTRNELAQLIKTLMISMLCAIPIILLLSIFLANVISMIALVAINVVVLVGAGVAGYFFSIYRQQRIKQKREEYLASQKKANKDK